MSLSPDDITTHNCDLYCLIFLINTAVIDISSFLVLSDGTRWNMFTDRIRCGFIPPIHSDDTLEHEAHVT